MTSTPLSSVAAEPFALPPVARGDFPGWLPPMLVKELRQGLRTRGFVGTFIVFQALMAFIMLGVVTSAGSTNQTVRAMSLNTANVFFWALLSLQLLVFTPGRALGGLQLESDSRTLDLLLLTRLDAWRIVMGKWTSLITQAALLLIAMLPYGIVRYFAGSVDLMADARTCAILLGGSALLTAAGLWGAGMGKVFRLFGVVLMVMFSSAGSSLFSAVSRGGFAPGPLVTGGSVSLATFDGALVLVFFLVAAVRNIAPPAENHALLARSLPLLALAAVPVGALCRAATSAIQGQLMFAGGFLMLVCAVELASLQLPMFVHWQRWRARAAMPRVVFRMALPGWPSALLFATMGTVLWGFCAVAFDLTHGGTGPRTWPAVLGLSALVFPSLLMSFFVRVPRSPGGVYGLFSAAGIIVAVLGMALPQSYPQLGPLRDFIAVLPVSSFIMAFGDPPGVAAVFVQAVIAALVLGFAWFQARHYWHVLAVLELRDRPAKP
jgi:hypothetical protein